MDLSLSAQLSAYAAASTPGNLNRDILMPGQLRPWGQGRGSLELPERGPIQKAPSPGCGCNIDITV